jgi:hypothetical protein
MSRWGPYTARDFAVLHPKGDTFPGEVFMRVAADALVLATAALRGQTTSISA